MPAFRLLFIVWLLPVALISQTAETRVDSTQLDLKPVPVTEVPSQVETLNRRSNQFGKDLNTPEALEQITSSLPGLDSLVGVSMTGFDTTDLSLHTLDQLGKLESDWQRYLSRLNGWNKTIAERLSLLGSDHDEIILAIKTWNLTIESLQGQEVPETISDDIVQSEEKLRILRDSVSAKMSILLTLQSTSSQLVNGINDRLAVVVGQRQELLRNIFIPERPLLWRMATDSSEFDFFAGLSGRMQRASNQSVLYFENRPAILYIIPLVFLVVLSTLLYYKFRFRVYRKEIIQTKTAIDLVLKWPVGASLLLTWLFLVFSFPDLPVESRNAVALVMLIPLSLILFGLLNRRLIWVLVFDAFFLFDLVYIIMVEDAFVQRMALLTFGLGTLGILIWLLYTKASSKLGNWSWFVTLVLQVASLNAFGSLVANLIGSVQLAEILLLGTTGSVIAAITLFSVVSLLVAVITVVFSIPLFQRSMMIRNYESAIVGRLERILHIIALLWWGEITLNGFRIGQQVYDWFMGILNVTWEIGSLSLSPGDILAFVLTLWITILFSKFIRFFLEEEVFQRTNLPKGVPGTITILIRYGTITLGFLLAIAAAGIQLDKLAIVLGALGVGIGFGLQDIINNLISGIVLALERPAQVGDVVQVGELMGIVKEIGFRASKVRTYEGSEVIVPNGHLVSNQMINWTLTDTKRRLKVDLGVAFGSDPQTVLDLMAEAANDHEEILKDPAPRPRFMGFGESALEFQLLYWIPDFDDGFRLGTEMTLAVHKKITEAGIIIPFPQRDLHVISNEKDRPKEIEELIKLRDLKSEDEAKDEAKAKAEAEEGDEAKIPAPTSESSTPKEGFDVDGD